ncbi:DNA-directed RNA polymerase [Thiohalobacter thiocyanaticus]|uniref:DNA-directed RNA polymerase n=1 Tax=Thiohalobacter thiocyanaticus TaxID=585455 RepID=A0A1Z4VQD9_9GAMM|nr:sigma-70 family RNA polymerase sigma factor [Thiohalobacter thiocyanaticus]BAZ93538.1 DNA-directed RNA polymerase [Thiohalobacter thiocyanaticus]
MSWTYEQHLADFYRQHHSWLQQLLRRRAGCSETAADLAQDTFLRLLSRDEDLSRIDSPRAYLTRIAQGLLANHWRRRDIEQAYLDALSRQPEALAPSPEVHHLIVETLYRLDAALRDLPEQVRQAFLLSRLEGVRYADIAAEFGVSERMVKKYIARAMLQCLQADLDLAA